MIFKNPISNVKYYFGSVVFIAFFLLFANNALAAVKPPECSGLSWYTPTLADSNAGKCPSTQTQITNATDGCADGQKLIGCGKSGLGASIPVFGCCASEYKADMSDVSTGPCSKEDIVECYVGSEAPPLPSKGGSSAYKCVEAGECEGGTIVAGATCVGGIAPKLCCRMDYCAAAPEDAGSAPVAKTYKLTNPLGTSNLNNIAKTIIDTFLGIVGALALLVFVYGGIRYMIGTEASVKIAKDTMKYAIIGVFIIMFSYVLTDTFISLWTVDLGTPTLTSPAEVLNAPTQAEQEVVTLKEQQQAAQKAEAEAKAAAKTAKSDVCGQTPATSGYSCQTLTTAEQKDYDCLSGYCQSNSSSNYLCCKKK